jgi:ubiquitin-activating enzyme E1
MEKSNAKHDDRRSFFQCPATVSVLGAVAAQEVVKACSCSHYPLSQLFTFQSIDSTGCTETNHVCNDSDQNNQHDLHSETEDNAGMDNAKVKLYGPSVVKEMSKLRVFVVGVGAIGCEVLKVLEHLNVGGDKTIGSITITDPDYIEKSNLNRQLLFRERHIGMSKAIVAADYLKNISGNTINVTPLTLAMSSETEHIFSPKFWQNIDVVITALDSSEARMYVDKQCVANGIWMIDAGTVGLKGSTQVVIPFVSESYASLDNIPEKEIPVCTLKTFPYKVMYVYNPVVPFRFFC